MTDGRGAQWGVCLWESGRADFSLGSTRVGIDYRLVNRGGIYHQPAPLRTMQCTIVHQHQGMPPPCTRVWITLQNWAETPRAGEASDPPLSEIARRRTAPDWRRPRAVIVAPRKLIPGQPGGGLNSSLGNLEVVPWHMFTSPDLAPWVSISHACTGQLFDFGVCSTLNFQTYSTVLLFHIWSTLSAQAGNKPSPWVCFFDVPGGVNHLWLTLFDLYSEQWLGARGICTLAHPRLA